MSIVEVKMTNKIKNNFWGDWMVKTGLSNLTGFTRKRIFNFLGLSNLGTAESVWLRTLYGVTFHRK